MGDTSDAGSTAPERPRGWLARQRERLGHWTRGMRAWLAGAFAIRWVAWLAVGAAVAVLAVLLRLVPPPPIWPLLTTGRIYVETPEVYTRERLVNDRYRQDFWLKSQLDRLDAGQELIRERRFVAVGAGSEAEAAPGEDLALPFQEDFFLRAAARDKIRQLILENLLDDRHDLTGNSIYGLKFDTAVIPGRNTYARPYVVVEIRIDPFNVDRPEDSGARDGADAGDDVDPASFLAVPPDESGLYAGTPFFDAARQFRRWEEDLESRLNRYLEASRMQGQCMTPPPTDGADVLVSSERDKLEAADADAGRVLAAAPGPDDQDTRPEAAHGQQRAQEALIRRALQQVMGIEAREITVPDPRPNAPIVQVLLPDPWDKFFYLHISGIAGGGGPSDLFMDLKSTRVTLHLADAEAWRAYEAEVRDEGRTTKYWVQRFVRLPADEAAGDAAMQAFIVEDTETRRTLAYDWPFARGLNQHEISQLQERGGADAQCTVPADPVTGASGCSLRSARHMVDASLYNFIKGISEIDAYSYAVFPRGDVEGVLSSFAASGGGRLPEAAANLGLGAIVRTQSAAAEPVVVNFAGGDWAGAPAEEATRARYEDVIDFGWAFVKPGRQRATQVSQLVLVSVPAYIDRLELDVTTGWLDDDAGPIAGTRRSETMAVVLPPDYEALDTLVIGGTKRQGPVIDDSQFAGACGSVRVRACAKADLLIPGERLWRSTSVTLGGQIADRITVMPDMRGIVATFDPVEPPLDPANPRKPLIVWTSESSARLGAPVEIDWPGDCQQSE
jgi:hypothetical protein